MKPLLFLTSLLLTLTLCLPGTAHAATLNVPAQYATIQAAVNAAANGDTVQVAAGTYTGPGDVDVDFSGKSLTVTSVSGPAATIIDCQASAATLSSRGFIIDSGEMNATINGFTVKNGYQVQNDSGVASGSGGGIFLGSNTPGSSLTVSNCIITSCYAAAGENGGVGGGIYAECNSAGAASTITISNCTITGNTAVFAGGGVDGSAAGNATFIMLNCTIAGNTAADGPSVGNGGGVYDSTDSISGAGAGSVIVIGCAFANNTAAHEGGGVASVNNTYGTIQMTNCTLTGNSTPASGGGGGGSYHYGGTQTVTNCSYTGNSGEGLYNSSVLTLTNVIFYGDTGGEIDDTSTQPLTVSNCDVQGGYAGTSNIDADPLFVGPPDDLHLQAGSPCIGAGILTDDTIDKDGKTRPNPPSIGAYEGGTAGAATTVAVANVTGTAGQTVTLSATLTATSGGGLSGKTLTFQVDNASGNVTTNASGVATATYAVPSSDTPGGHTVTVTFAGDASDAPSTGTGTLTVTAATSPNQVRFYPRSSYPSRMIGGLFQGSHDNSSWTTLATVTTTPAANQYSTLPTNADPATFRYLRYLAPNGSYGNVAEIEFDSNSTKLTGTGFGTAGSYNNDGLTFDKALDGSTSTYFDAPAPGNGDYVGIDRGGSSPNYVRFYPRVGKESRMVGGLFQGSANNSTWTTLYTVTQTPADAYTTAAISTDPASFRYLRYLAPNGSYGDVAEVEFYSHGTKLTGTGFGTPGSYNNSGTTFAKALDGSTSTYFDAPAPGNGDYVGIDRGGSSPNYVRFYPRSGYEGRMVGGLFQGSANNSTWTTLATVTATPAANQYSTLSTGADPAGFRYLRYLAPNGSCGNVAEIEFDSNGTKLTGTGFGTVGSYNNDGLTFQKALDGSTSTYFDAPAPGNGDYVGIDRGGPAPTITSFSPTSGPVGTDVLINGTNFTSLTGVKFGGIACTTFAANSATQVEAIVPAGAVTGTVSVSTTSGTATSTSTYTVTAAPAALKSLTYNPNPAYSSGLSVGTITLMSPAPAGGASVTITSSGTLLATVVIPAGQTSATYEQMLGVVTTSTSYTLTASYNSTQVSATLTANPTSVTLSGFSLSPNPVAGGATITGTITLSAAAPSGGAAVLIYQGSTYLGYVTVFAGSTTAQFSVTAPAESAPTAVSYSESYNGATKSASVTVN